jgi:hypothetical protein
MSCQVCFNAYDHSLNKPYSLSSCSHTICWSCLNLNKLDHCLICNKHFNNKHINSALLEFISISSNDILKAEVLKSINEISQILVNLDKKRSKQIEKYEDIFKSVSLINNKLNQVEQLKLDEYLNSLEFNLKHKLVSSQIEDDINTQILYKRNLIDKDMLSKGKLFSFKEEILLAKAPLNDLADRIDKFELKVDINCSQIKLLVS